jgi:hypothetical protein
MARGKVVFTGAEQEFLDYYNLENDAVAINALPDVAYLVDKLSELIENPKKINKIGTKAHSFIIDYHEAKKISKIYLKFWGSALNKIREILPVSDVI